MVLFFFLKFMFIIVSLHYPGSANAVDGAYSNENGDKVTDIESVTAVEKLQGSQFRVSAMNVSGKEFDSCLLLCLNIKLLLFFTVPSYDVHRKRSRFWRPNLLGNRCRFLQLPCSALQSNVSHLMFTTRYLLSINFW